MHSLRSRHSLIALASISALGCAPDDALADDLAADELAARVAPRTALARVAAGAPTARVRAATLTVALDAAARVVALPAGTTALRFRGRASRPLEDAASWVPDDAFGAARVLGRQTFEVDLAEGHEANTLLAGAWLFVRLAVTTGDPRAYDAAFRAAPRAVTTPDGRSTEISVAPDVAAVYVRDGVTNLRYRARVATRLPLDALFVRAAGAEPAVRRAGALAWVLDWDYDGLARALAAGGALAVRARVAGRDVTTRATLGVAVTDLGLTADAPDEAFPPDGCDDAARACVRALGPATRDLGACGSYAVVRACLWEVSHDGG